MREAAIRLIDRDDGIAVVAIDQPNRRANVLTLDLWKELDAAIDSIPENSRGLLLTSTKPGSFIAGADLRLLGRATFNDPGIREVISFGLRVIEKLEALPFPTCAVLDGSAIGGGLEVALACDVRVASSGATMGLPEVALGLIPGWGGTQRLPRIIGWSAAIALLQSGTIITAERALEIGLLSGVFDADLLSDGAIRTLPFDRGLASRAKKQRPIPTSEIGVFHPTNALSEVAFAGATLPLHEAIRLETEAFFRLVGSEESKQKIGDFFAKPR